MQFNWHELARGFEEQVSYAAGYSSLSEAIFRFMAELTRKRADEAPLGFDEQTLAALLEQEWATRVFSHAPEAGLVFTAAIHASVLGEDPEAAPISRFFDTAGGSFEPFHDASVLWQMIGGLGLRPGDTFRWFLREGRIQTNETTRGVAWLLPAIVLSQWYPDLPITLVDLGCSAGLNLAADRLGWEWDIDGRHRTFGDSAPLIHQIIRFDGVEPAVASALTTDTPARPDVTQRIGIDKNPLNVGNAGDLLTLRACIHGDQIARMERLDHAIAAFQVLTPPPAIEAGDVSERAATFHQRITPATRLLLVYNTATTMYFAPDQYATLQQHIASAFASLPDRTRGVWIELEWERDAERQTGQFVLRGHVYRDGQLHTIRLGYTQPHPSNIRLTAGWENLRIFP